MKQITKESDAWFLLAEEFSRSPESGFLCGWLTYHADKFYNPRAALFQRRVGRDTRLGMDRRIALDLLHPGHCAYATINDPDNADDVAPEETVEPRVLACLMFGWEAKSEGR